MPDLLFIHLFAVNEKSPATRLVVYSMLRGLAAAGCFQHVQELRAHQFPSACSACVSENRKGWKSGSEDDEDADIRKSQTDSCYDPFFGRITIPEMTIGSVDRTRPTIFHISQPCTNTQ